LRAKALREKTVGENDEATERIKRDILDAARQLLQSGMVEGTSGNLSARLPGGHVAVTPSSLAYETMTAEDLVVVDMQGERVSGERPPTTEKALHLACLRAHSDIGAVIHSHALFCSMFAIARQPIPCVIEEFDVYVGGDVQVAEYRLTGSDELGEEVARHVGDRGAVLMANHGLLTVGRDIADAMKVAHLVERTAQIVWGSRLLGSPVPLPEETLKRFAPIYKAMRRR
jgi:L-fuculose-phosphate aldolase